MPTDQFARAADSLIAPADECFPIVPHDTDTVHTATKAIYVGTGGSVVVRPLRGDSDVTFRNVQSGSILDIRVAAIRATGTTAADIVGLV